MEAVGVKLLLRASESARRGIQGAANSIAGASERLVESPCSADEVQLIEEGCARLLDACSRLKLIRSIASEAGAELASRIASGVE